MDKDFIDATVTWQDNLRDTARMCIICHNPSCTDPVHKENYKIRVDKVAASWDAENPVI